MPVYYHFDESGYIITIIVLGSQVSSFKVYGSDVAGDAWDAACKFMETIGGYGYLIDVSSGEVVEIYEG